MTAFAIFVTIRLKPGCLGEYLGHIRYDAESALRDEEGCQLFHILEPKEGSNLMYLYEVYDDEAAFNLHQQTPHFKKYIKATEDLVEERLIERLHCLN